MTTTWDIIKRVEHLENVLIHDVTTVRLDDLEHDVRALGKAAALTAEVLQTILKGMGARDGEQG